MRKYYVAIKHTESFYNLIEPLGSYPTIKEAFSSIENYYGKVYRIIKDDEFYIMRYNGFSIYINKELK